MVSAALALAQERGATGRDLLTAFIAGAEVMIRIARATKKATKRGASMRPFGAAVACGKLLGFDRDRMVNALGIAGSLSSGLVEFSRSGTGVMVKRLHFGRAAEGGLLAANLAARGFTGPTTILEGECGFLKVFCDDRDMSQLTRELGRDWLTSCISMKRYACHTAGHTPVQAIVDFRKNEGLTASDEAIDGPCPARAVDHGQTAHPDHDHDSRQNPGRAGAEGDGDRFQGDAEQPARPGRIAREVPHADPALRPNEDGRHVRPAAADRR